MTDVSHLLKPSAEKNLVPAVHLGESRSHLTKNGNHATFCRTSLFKSCLKGCVNPALELIWSQCV